MLIHSVCVSCHRLKMYLLRIGNKTFRMWNVDLACVSVFTRYVFHRCSLTFRLSLSPSVQWNKFRADEYSNISYARKISTYCEYTTKPTFIISVYRYIENLKFVSRLDLFDLIFIDRDELTFRVCYSLELNRFVRFLSISNVYVLAVR